MNATGTSEAPMNDDLTASARDVLSRVPEMHRRRGVAAGGSATIGAIAGSVIAGPIGAAVGGAIGAAIGVAAEVALEKERKR